MTAELVLGVTAFLMVVMGMFAYACGFQDGWRKANREKKNGE